MGQNIQACSTAASMTKDKPYEQDHNQQNDSDLLPFNPDFQGADAQPVISNLLQLKDCEFDHNYILHHLEQLEIDPTLCLKCSTASKYFASPEPFVQDLYKKSCYWERIAGSSLSMDISPYATLDKPYYHIDNLGLEHPPNRPQGQVHIKRVFQRLKLIQNRFKHGQMCWRKSQNTSCTLIWLKIKKK